MEEKVLRTLACENLGLEAGWEFCLNWNDMLIPLAWTGLGVPGCVPRPGKLSLSRGKAGCLSGPPYLWSSHCCLSASVLPLRQGRERGP